MTGFKRTTGLTVIIAAALILINAQAFANNWQLLTGSRYGAGSNPSSIAVADFDNDGDFEIAIANHSIKRAVSIIPGKSDHTFGAKDTAIDIENDPIAITTADFDGDGYMDIATANWAEGNVSVLLGNANRTFQTHVDYPTGLGAVHILAADFDGDGITDLATANFYDNNVSVLIGAGDGTFAAAVDSLAGNTPRGIAAGDFDVDGIPDIAAVNWDDDTVSVLFGNGDGTFVDPSTVPDTTIAIGVKPWGVAAYDLDGDGDSDIIATTGASDFVYVMLSNGDGTFAAAESYRSHEGPSAVSVADMNIDGMADLVVTNSLDNDVSIFMGKGDGTFWAPAFYYTSAYPLCPLTVDFTMDGIPDLLVANYTGSSVSSYKGSIDVVGAWSIGPESNFPAGVTPGHIVAGSFDLDNFQDVIVTDATGATRQLSTGNGDGTLNGPAAYVPPVTVPSCDVTSDFNKDGLPDLAVANVVPNNISVQFGLAGGGLDVAVDYPVGTAPGCLVVTDLNNDAWPDLVFPNTVVGVGSVSYLLNKGDGTYDGPYDTTVGNSPMGVAVRDFDGDNWFDIAVANEADDTVSVLLSNHDGTFADQTGSPYAVDLGPTGLFFFDVDLDGYFDMVVTNSAADTVSILLGQPDGTFEDEASTPYAVGSGPVSVAMADFDRNGWPDLAVANAGDDSVSILPILEESTLTTDVFTSGASDPAGGSIDEPGGLYNTGTVFTINATPNFGYVFTGWTGDVSTKDNPLQIVLRDDMTVNANFVPGPFLTGIAPNNGSMGDLITLTGVNFGIKKGKVSVGGRSVKVSAWSDTSITFIVHNRLPSGATTVQVLANKLLSNKLAFTVNPPVITALAPAAGTTEDVITVTGTDFGNRKPKVYLVATTLSPASVKLLSCKVTAYSKTSLTVVLPKKILAADSYAIRVVNTHNRSNNFPITIF